MKDREETFESLERDFSRLTERFTQRAEKFLKARDSGFNQELTEQEKSLIRRYNDVLGKITATPLYSGTVIGSVHDEAGKKDLLAVNCNGRLLFLNKLDGKELRPGDLVKVSSKTMQIVEPADNFTIGDICVVREVLGEISEVDLNGNHKIVFNGHFVGKISGNDRVILDASNSIVIGWLGNSQKRFKLGNKPTVTWDDIGGQGEAKGQLIEAIEIPLKYKELYVHYNKKPIRGAVIFGPPGCGKTMLLEAVATAIAKLYGQEALESGFINIKGAEILDMYVGVAEGMVRQIFAAARAHKREYGYPAIIAIDEAEALLPRRGSRKSSDVETTIVPAFLAEMQGIDDSDAIVLLSTNRIDLLDPAVVRDGRIDRNIEVTRPDTKSARMILGLNLKNIPLADGVWEEMAVFAAEEFYSPKYKFYEIKQNNGEVMSFTLANLINGAMLAGVIDKATSFAVRRDIESGKKSGLTKDDIRHAVQQTYEQKFNLDHRDELTELIKDFREDLSLDSIQKVRQATKP